MSQSRPARPRKKPAPGVGLASVGPRGRHVRGKPQVHAFRLREPAHGGVYGVAHRNRPARADDSAHFLECRHGIVHVLKHLVGVDHVERAVFEGQRERVADGQLDPAQQASGRQGRPGGFNRRGRGIKRNDPPGRHKLGQIGGDGSRPASDVEQIHARMQARKEVGCRIQRAAARVPFEHSRAVPVGVPMLRGLARAV